MATVGFKGLKDVLSLKAACLFVQEDI